jgi:hypothetical protein
MARLLIIAGHYRRPTGCGGHIRQIVRRWINSEFVFNSWIFPQVVSARWPKRKRGPWFATLPGQLCRYPAHRSAASGQDC